MQFVVNYYLSDIFFLGTVLRYEKLCLLHFDYNFFCNVIYVCDAINKKNINIKIITSTFFFYYFICFN